ncbi:MAG: PAS domain S-box protein [Candidatus Omnitrophica bacterium]|nr:PAS domain S-box protein [Candidatus Omnitrophota bacterium]
MLSKEKFFLNKKFARLVFYCLSLAVLLAIAILGWFVHKDSLLPSDFHRFAVISVIFVLLIFWAFVSWVMAKWRNTLLRMDRELEEQAQKLAEHNRIMEQKVSDRTKELGHRNEKLRQEITERIRAEQKIKEGEQWLYTTLQSIGDGVIATDAQGDVKFMNLVAEQLTGWKQHEAVGKPLKKIFKTINQKTRQEMESPVERVLQEGAIVGLGNHILIAKTGAEKFLDDSGAPIRDFEGRIIGVVLIFRDVTEKRQVEQKFRLSEERNRLVVETANDAFVEMDEQGIITNWNQQAEKTFGWQKSEILGKALADTIIPPKFREAHRKGIKRYLETGENVIFNKRIELPALHRHGHEFPVELTVWPVEVGETRHFNAFIRDISERLQYQRQLVQGEKLMAIGHLAAGIAHEINNPIGFIGSNLMTLQKYLELFNREFKKLEGKKDLEETLADSKALLRESQEGVERVRKIVSDLKTFSRVDTGTLEVANLHHVIEGVLNIVSSEIKYKAELKKDYGDIPLIKCNPQQIGQVIINILINAVHAISDKGVIGIKTYVQDSWCCIEISDNGIGIPQEIVDKIFDPFFTTKEVGKGTGLGLSISYDIVKKHQGKIAVASEPGKGTRLTVFLPLTDSAAS